MLKTLFGWLPFAAGAGFPVQVSGEQARAYCAWRGGRLATEAELHRAAYHTPDGSLRPIPGATPARSRARQLWLSPLSSHPRSVSFPPATVPGVSASSSATAGNGRSRRSRCGPALSPGPAPIPGYSADFFDGEHDIVFGASWATADGLLRRSFRNWYRRSYPFPFTSFRVVS